MNVEEYRSVLHEDMALAANANMSTESEEFINYSTHILIDGEEFDDYVECYYEGISKRNWPMRIDGYSMDESDGSCCVFVADYRGKYESESILNEDINNAFRRIRRFIEESIKYEFYQELEESTQAYEFARTLYYDNDQIVKFRFYLLTDAYNKQRKKNIKDEELSGKKVELNVWDIARLFDVVSSTSQKESVEIELSDFNTDGIPCVKAVDYKDVVADIEVLPKMFTDDETEKDQQEKPENVITYSSYLAVVPGQILSDLYLEYG